MAYTISFTDTTKPDSTITVEDSTINTDTSLRLPGRNSTAYGAVIAENFLHLLENFANSQEPTAPVEGQLWYDTTAPETLRIYNGTNWIAASGITKSISNPTSPIIGDLWVDTDNQQLYLWTGGGWILVGPQFSEGLATGVRANQIIGQDNELYTVLLVEVAGSTVGIISGSDTPFTPKTAIAGFSIINPGFNVISRDTNSDGLSNFKFFGTAEKAESLIVNNKIIPAGDFLRGDTTSTTDFPLNVQNNQGISYGINGELTVGVEGTAGIIQHNIGGSNIDIRVRNQNLSKTVIRVDSNLRVGVNTEAPEQALDVVGSIQSSENLFVNGLSQSTTINNGAMIVRGGAAIKKNLNIGGETKLNGLTTTSNIVPDDTNLRDIGAAANKYRNVYASTFIGSFSGNVTGSVTGRSTETDKLTSRTTFIMTGDVVTDTPVEYDGTFQDPNFDNGVDSDGNPLPQGELPLQKKFITSISNNFIAGKPLEDEVANNDLLLFNDIEGATPGLKSVTKSDLLKTIPRQPAGIILPYAGDAAPADWLLCDGREIEIDSWRPLFNVIGFKFKPQSQVQQGFFALPDMRGRMPLGADDMGTSAGSANVVTAASADVVGSKDGAESKLIGITQIPDHEHDLQDDDNNQFYVYQDRLDPTTDQDVEQTQGPDAAGTAQRLDNSGGIAGRNNTPQTEFNVMPPTITLNYIIFSGRE